MVLDRNPIDERLRLAEQLSSELRKSQRRNLRAVGVVGSVARGTAQEYSDIDVLVLVRKNPKSIPRQEIRNNIYCSINPETWTSAVEQITRVSHPHDYLPEILGGFTRIQPIFDPEKLLPRLERLAGNVPARLFKKSAELALVHSYEDFCRANNAVLHGDDALLKENVWYVTHQAANIVAALNQAHFESDREISRAYKKLDKLPKQFNRIQQLRFGNLRGMKLFKLFLSFYVDLVRFCEEEGVNFPVDETTLTKLKTIRS